MKVLAKIIIIVTIFFRERLLSDIQQLLHSNATPLATNRKVPIKNFSHMNFEKIKIHRLKMATQDL